MKIKHDLGFTGEIYSKEEYDRIIEEIKKLSKTKSPEILASEISKKMNLTLILGYLLNKEIIQILNLFRLRIPKENEIIEEDKMSSYYYPPIVKEMGRANVVDQQVFYASADAHTTFHEMRVDTSNGYKIGYLSKWGINHPGDFILRTLFFGIPENQENYASIMSIGLKEKMQQFLSGIPKFEQENFLYGQERYNDLFTSKGKDFYHISSSIVKDMFSNKIPDMPGLLYPSVAKDKTSVNYVIRKDFADKYLYMKEVYKVKINEVSDEQIKTEIIAKGNINNGKVCWTFPKWQFDYKTLFLTTEENTIEFRDLQKDEYFIIGDNDESVEFNQVLAQLNITKESILQFLLQQPISFEYSDENSFNILIKIPIREFPLHTNFLNIGEIKYIHIPLICKILFV